LHWASPHKSHAEFAEALRKQLESEGPEAYRNPPHWFAGYQFPYGIVIRDGPGLMVEPDYVSFQSEGGLDFSHSTIAHSVRCENATVLGKARFSNATIKGDLVLRRTTLKDLDLRDASIEGALRMENVSIQGGASFKNVAIEGDVALGDTTIRQDARFADANFGGDVVFQHVTVEGKVDLSGAFAHGLVPRAKMVGWGLGLSRCGVDLRPGRHMIEYWSFAKNTFARNGERSAADTGFYFERIWRWRELLRSRAVSGLKLAGLRTVLLRAGYSALWLLDLLFLRWTTAYGASLARLIATWFVVIGGFGIAYSLRPSSIESASASPGTLEAWIIGIHYSATTFATLGLGHLNPGESLCGMVLTSIEALLGAILIALSVLVVGRRFTRSG